MKRKNIGKFTDFVTLREKLPVTRVTRILRLTQLQKAFTEKRDLLAWNIDMNVRNHF